MDNKERCFGTKPNQELYAKYHDEEWGVPVYDDNQLFEMLVLESAHAGLSFEIILKKRDGYRKAFYNFDPVLVSQMLDDELEKLMHNKEIVRNRLKIYSTRENARIFLELQKEFGSFKDYIWGYVDNKIIKNHPKNMSELQSSSELSDKISKDLKKRGMKFVGTTIIYAYLQAIGIIDDHLTYCWKY